MKVGIVSGSMAENSCSRGLATVLKQKLEAQSVDVEWIDLRDVPMEFCDGRKGSYGEAVDSALARLDECSGILFAYGVYCYSIPASLKNFVDIGFPSMKKPFGQIIAAGGANSFLAHEHFSQILKNEVHAPVYPGVVYADYPQYPGGELQNEKLEERIDKYVDGFLDFTRKLSV